MTITISSRKSSSNKKINRNTHGLRVIGAGLPRTGTTSLKAALEILGFGPCHHMVELIDKPDRSLQFIRAYQGEHVDFYELMEGYGSTVDTPTTDFYKELHRAYPQAKIILTVRDSNEKWFESFQNTIGSLMSNRFHVFLTYPLRSLRLLMKIGDEIGKKWRRDYGCISPSLHEQHNRRVIDENSPDEILVYNVKDGWEPLCKFLQVNIPENVPFPNINDTKQFKRKVNSGRLVGLCCWLALGAIQIFGLCLSPEALCDGTIDCDDERVCTVANQYRINDCLKVSLFWKVSQTQKVLYKSVQKKQLSYPIHFSLWETEPSYKIIFNESDRIGDILPHVPLNNPDNQLATAYVCSLLVTTAIYVNIKINALISPFNFDHYQIQYKHLSSHLFYFLMTAISEEVIPKNNVTYLYIRDCEMHFNNYLTYSIRSRNIAGNYVSIFMKDSHFVIAAVFHFQLFLEYYRFIFDHLLAIFHGIIGSMNLATAIGAFTENV
ncbi:unnamed protein product [Adineta ricciae]|uniref:Uncharacterized protein n=1 Tax=Adineta ricciae TaxID=249248 RepID=A0A813NSZ7_ADIRI|nr:unnamed protein product [Adineta ricciae]